MNKIRYLPQKIAIYRDIINDYIKMGYELKWERNTLYAYKHLGHGQGWEEIDLPVGCAALPKFKSVLLEIVKGYKVKGLK